MYYLVTIQSKNGAPQNTTPFVVSEAHLSKFIDEHCDSNSVLIITACEVYCTINPKDEEI